MALIVTAGGAIVGYCAIGRVRSGMPPASMMTIAITQAKTGRSMKKRAISMPVTVAERSAAGCGMHRHVGLRFLQALHDQPVARS